LLKIYTTSPIASVTSEKIFSGLKRITAGLYVYRMAFNQTNECFFIYTSNQAK